MSHFAEIDSDGNVLRVIVANSKEWCETRLGGTWVQTSYNATIRKNYAGIGYKYDINLDAFVPPQPAYNYNLDTNTARWVFPDDNHLYIPTAPHRALDLSKALYKIVNPNGDGLYAGVIFHQEPTQYALMQCRSVDVIPVSVAADPQPLIDALQPTVDDGAITQAELDAIVQAVTDNAGQQVNLVDFIPASWLPMCMTKEQAIAGGWIEQGII
jgi:hypothetical protein